MKSTDVPPLDLGRQTLDAAFQTVFGEEVLRRVHGESLTIDTFDASNQRTLSFAIDVSKVPSLIRRFVCGRQMRVTTRQTLAHLTPQHWQITNAVKLHCVASELFRVAPVFWLQQSQDGHVRLGGCVKHTACLPPPLKGIAERFMASKSERELRLFAGQLQGDGPPQ